MNQKTNDNCNVHKNQINFLIENINIKCVNSEHHEKHKISRNYIINIIIVNNIKNIKKINDNICKINVNIKKKTKIINEIMNEDIQEIVVDETRVLLKNDTIDDEFVLKEINLLHEDHEKSFIVINNSSFDCYRLTDVFSFYSAETETETTNAAE
jgi:hypothetical protein